MPQPVFPEIRYASDAGATLAFFEHYIDALVAYRDVAGRQWQAGVIRSVVNLDTYVGIYMSAPSGARFRCDSDITEFRIVRHRGKDYDDVPEGAP